MKNFEFLLLELRLSCHKNFTIYAEIKNFQISLQITQLT